MRKIRFAPGKGNQKLIAMYNDGAEVWDTKEVGSAPHVCTAGEATGHRKWAFFLPSDLEMNIIMGLSNLKQFSF